MRPTYTARLTGYSFSTVCLLPLVSVLVLTGFHWHFWKIFFPLSSPNRFLDLELITFNAACYASNPMVEIKDLLCDPTGRAFNYPRAMLEIASKSGVQGSDTFFLGVVFQVALVAVLFLLISNIRSNFERLRSTFQLIFCAFLVASPPVFFVLERGNTDSLMFVLVLVALFLNLFNRHFSSMLIFVAFTIKLYPIAAITPFLVTKKFRSTGWILITFACCWAFFNLSDYYRVWNSSPLYEWYSFGLRAIPYQLTTYLPYALTGKSGVLLSQLLGGLLFVFCCILYLVLLKHSKRFNESFSGELKRFLSLKPRESLLIMASTNVFFLTYFMGLNWDTKLLFLIPYSLFFIFVNYTIPIKASIPILVFWLSGFPHFLFLQTIGDLILTLFAVNALFLFVALKLPRSQKLLGVLP